MNKLIMVMGICILCGCYSKKDDCYHGMTRICNGENYPPIAHYQKPFSLGKTNVEQRWKDVESCGGINIKRDSNHFNIKGARDKNGRLILSVAYEFRNCMKRKGYLYLSNDECGRKNSTTDKGICNE